MSDWEKWKKYSLEFLARKNCALLGKGWNFFDFSRHPFKIKLIARDPVLLFACCQGEPAEWFDFRVDCPENCLCKGKGSNIRWRKCYQFDCPFTADNTRFISLFSYYMLQLPPSLYVRTPTRIDFLASSSFAPFHLGYWLEGHEPESVIVWARQTKLPFLRLLLLLGHESLSVVLLMVYK